MATLKDHQQAMVDLLANGSGIPASASRLAHAMHDVLSAMLGDKKESLDEEMTRLCNERIEATTPGLNDKALAADVEACRPKQEIKESLLRAKERRVKELENTVRQLREQVAKQRKDIAFLKMARNNAVAQLPEKAGCRKDDTQVCEHDFKLVYWGSDVMQCSKCGVIRQ